MKKKTTEFWLCSENQQPWAKVRVELCQLKRKSVASAVSINVMVSSCLIQLGFFMFSQIQFRSMGSIL